MQIDLIGRQGGVGERVSGLFLVHALDISAYEFNERGVNFT